MPSDNDPDPDGGPPPRETHLFYFALVGLKQSSEPSRNGSVVAASVQTQIGYVTTDSREAAIGYAITRFRDRFPMEEGWGCPEVICAQVDDEHVCQVAEALAPAPPG